jgi:uncharacterized heparinase superfamily protein
MTAHRVLLYARTLRHLRLVQVTNRVWRRVHRPAVPAGELLDLRPVTRAFVQGVRRPASLVGPARVRFLGEEGVIDSAAAWNDPRRPMLWRYQLHYFDDLHALGAESRREWQRELISRWVQENPAGVGAGWDPYPLSLRVVNWIKWHLDGNTLENEARASLVRQVRYLRPRLEYHLLANHLLENLKALVVAGCFFNGPEAEGWREEGLRKLQAEVREQVLADGAHFERAPMYHSLALEGLLDVLNILRTYDFSVPAWLTGACERMIAWSVAMAHPDGEWAQFNDTALSFAARASDLVSYWQRLGGTPPASSSDPTVLRDSGFVRARCGELLLFADVGALGPDYNPAHGHADTLTFELSLADRRLVVDTGISTYEVGPVRARERSTSAHNTVEIDREDSSEVWDSFRVARRAGVHGLQVNTGSDSVSISAEHDGYARLRGRARHQRHWRLTARELEVTDVIRTSASHELRSRIHLHPRYSVRAQTSEVIHIVDDAERHVASLHRGSWHIAQLERYEYASEFGRRQQANVIVLEHRCSGEATLCFTLRTA